MNYCLPQCILKAAIWLVVDLFMSRKYLRDIISMIFIYALLLM